MNRRSIYRRADRIFGSLAILSLLPFRFFRGKRNPPDKPKRIGIVKLVGFGDTVLLLTVAETLRRRHPAAEIVAIATPQSSALFRKISSFDAVLELDILGKGNALTRFLDMIAALRSRRFDILMDCEQHFRLLPPVCLLAGAGFTAGFHYNPIRGLLYDRTVFLEPRQHMLKSYFDLLAVAGVDGEVPGELAKPVFKDNPSRETAKAIADLKRRHPVLIGIHAGAGARGRIKQWPLERFSELVEALAAKIGGAAFVLTGTPDDSEINRRVLEGLGAARSRALDISGVSGIEDTAAWLFVIDAVIIIDTGLMHFSAAMGVPTVALFGPESPQRYAPIGKKNRSLYFDPGCSPCIRNYEGLVPECLHDEKGKCLDSISVEMVLREVMSALGRKPAAGPG